MLLTLASACGSIRRSEQTPHQEQTNWNCVRCSQTSAAQGLCGGCAGVVRAFWDKWPNPLADFLWFWGHPPLRPHPQSHAI
jgi:hypothetical protein